MHDLSEARWRTSSRSQASGNCVEVAFVGARAVVRDSKNLGGPAVVVARPAFAALLDRAKAGTLTPAVVPGVRPPAGVSPRRGEDSWPVVGDGDRVLDVGGTAAVAGEHRPAIGRQPHGVPATGHEHRFDGDHHAGTQR
jgi:hypothetical protein